jgi:hypothetical protein
VFESSHDSFGPRPGPLFSAAMYYMSTRLNTRPVISLDAVKNLGKVDGRLPAI